jgi:hypothetical protein
LQILASCKSKTALNLSYFQVFDSIQGSGEIRLDESPSVQHQKTGRQVAGDDFFVVSSGQQSTHAGYSSKSFDLIAQAASFCSPFSTQLSALAKAICLHIST